MVINLLSPSSCSLISSTEYCDSFVVKIIEGAGHYPHQEMSDEFNQIILKFLVGEWWDWLDQVSVKGGLK